MNALTDKQLEAPRRPQQKASSASTASTVSSTHSGGGGSASSSTKPALQPGLRGERTCLCSGTLQETKGHYGWIIPSQKIDHTDSRKHRGGIYLDTRDIRPGSPLRKGDDVSFYVFVDKGGLGAEDVRLKDMGGARPEAKPELWETLKSRGQVSAAVSSAAAQVAVEIPQNTPCSSLTTGITSSTPKTTPTMASDSSSRSGASRQHLAKTTTTRKGRRAASRGRCCAGGGGGASEVDIKESDGKISLAGDPILRLLLRPPGLKNRSVKDSEDEASDDTDASTRAETESSHSSSHSSPGSAMASPCCDDVDDSEEDQLVDVLRAELRQARARAGGLAANIGHKEAEKKTMAKVSLLDAVMRQEQMSPPVEFVPTMRPPPGLPAPGGKPFEQILGQYLNRAGLPGKEVNLKAPPGLAVPLLLGCLM